MSTFRLCIRSGRHKYLTTSIQLCMAAHPHAHVNFRILVLVNTTWRGSRRGFPFFAGRRPAHRRKGLEHSHRTEVWSETPWAFSRKYDTTTKTRSNADQSTKRSNILVAVPRPPKFPGPTEDLLNHPEYRLGIRIRTPYVPTLAKFTCPSLSLAVITTKPCTFSTVFLLLYWTSV